MSIPTSTKRLNHHHHQTTENHQSTAEHHHDPPPLIPGLPDDVAHLCLTLVSPSTLFSVCRSWRRLIYSLSFPPFLSLYALLTSSPSNNNNNHYLQFSSFDPISHKWQNLPSPPLRLLLRHPSFISRSLPVQSVAVSGNLVLLAATADQFLPALSQPLIFNPLINEWRRGPPLTAPRRWCAAGACGGAVYVASGMGSHYDDDVARTIEKLEICRNSRNPNSQLIWEKLTKLRDCKFSREAIEAVGWKGKLCMVNVKGDAAKESIIYDVGSDTWQEMPEGMLSGWRGPAAAMDEETIYGVDESRGWLKRYDHVRDTWVEVVENEMMKGALQLVAARGKVCVLCADGRSVAVVNVAEAPPVRVWVVEVPMGLQAVGIHVLPRMSCLDV